jgi:dephospho-CoA kinase
MKVIALVGMPGAGKEEFVKVAMEEGWEVVRMGDVVRDYVRSQGLPLTDDVVGRIATEEREKHGPDIWARRTLERIGGSERVVIDGIRSVHEIRRFQEELGGDFLLVGIFASPRTRFERISRRGREDDARTWEEFVRRDMRELSWGLGEAFATADVMMVNEGTLEEFREKVRALLRGLVDGSHRISC